MRNGDRAFTTDIVDTPTFTLGRRLLGRPGPVWSMMATLSVVALLIGASLLTSLAHLSLPVGAIAIPALAYCLAGVIGLYLLGDRVPGVLLHVLVDVNVILIALATASRGESLTAALPLALVILMALYMASWFRRRDMWGHLVFMIVATGAAAWTHRETPGFVALWLTLMACTIAMAAFVQALVRDLHQQVALDALTGLPNRRGLELVAAARGGDRLASLPRAVAVLDLDEFKSVNDRGGHVAGDALLCEVARISRARLRPSDTFARTGGDEFVVLFPLTTVDQAEQILMRLVDDLPIGCSVGVADWRGDMSFEEAVMDADRLMYERKPRGSAASSP